MAQKTKSRPTPKQILDKAKWNSDGAYTSQITYTMESGYQISVAYIEGVNTRQMCEDALVHRVLENMGFED